MNEKPLPADRGHVDTEARNRSSRGLHKKSIAECVALMQDEERGVHDALARARTAIVAFIAAVEPGFLRGGRLIYLGAGTSGRLGVLDASEAPPTFQVEPGRVVGLIAGGDSALRRSSEGKEDDPNGARAELDALSLGADDALLAIAAGGTTPYALGALSIAKARSKPPVTALLVCAPISAPPHADHLIVV